MTIQRKLCRLVALAGSILTLAQIFFLVNEQDGICLNDGCKVVDSLTAVDPLFINLGGFFFFQAIFWGVWFAGKSNSWNTIVKAFLLAGLAAEGVLVSFQQFVAQTFCSYCLIIFALIFLLNIFFGLKHIATGAIIFLTVLLSFSSLQFSGGASSPFENINKGTYAQVVGNEDEKRYLFFSSTCKYCEKVIESLKEQNSCAVSFNPLDTITEFGLPAAEILPLYEPGVNIKLLSHLGIKQIPVLLITTESEKRIVTGSTAIQHYFESQCLQQKGAEIEEPQESVIGITPSSNLDFLPQNDDGCAIETDCEDPAGLLPSRQ